MGERVSTGGPSYRNKLLNLGRNDQTSRGQMEVVVTEKDFLIGKDGEIPSIDFSKGVREALMKGMEKTLIIKLLGRTINYGELLKRTRSLWQPKESYQLVDMEGSFYFATFDLEEDYIKVLTGGPWMIFGAYLTVQPWSLDFDPRGTMISKVVAWARIPGLSFRYYHKSTLRAIGKLLGEVIKIDYMTESRWRGKYARIAVLMDLQQPLVPWIKVDGKSYGVEYEGLPLICFDCGKYGHSKEKCTKAAQLVRYSKKGKKPIVGKDAKIVGLQGSSGSRYNVLFEADDMETNTPQSGDTVLQEPVAVKTVKSIAIAEESTPQLPVWPNKESTTRPIAQRDGFNRGSISGKGPMIEEGSSVTTSPPEASKKELQSGNPIFKVVKAESTLDGSKHMVVELQRCRTALEELAPPSWGNNGDPQVDVEVRKAQGRDKENVGHGPASKKMVNQGIKLQSTIKRNLKVRKKHCGALISKDAMMVIREELETPHGLVEGPDCSMVQASPNDQHEDDLTGSWIPQAA
ncbi:hypothetical protein K1719_029075 [Acacia pycnantha]|nr:hypothetical protein K1719_029075 [Acacia pycnantha]